MGKQAGLLWNRGTHCWKLRAGFVLWFVLSATVDDSLHVWGKN
jgi:hypothetical protein